MFAALKVLTLCYTVKFVSFWALAPCTCIHYVRVMMFQNPIKDYVLTNGNIFKKGNIWDLFTAVHESHLHMYMYLREYLYYTLKNFAHNILGLFTFKPLQETYCTNLWNTTPSHIHKAKKISPTSLQPCQSARCLGALFFHQCRTVMFMVGGALPSRQERSLAKSQPPHSSQELQSRVNVEPQSLSRRNVVDIERIVHVDGLQMGS